MSGLPAGMTDLVSAAGKPAWSCERGSANGPGLGSGGASPGAKAGGGTLPISWLATVTAKTAQMHAGRTAVKAIKAPAHLGTARGTAPFRPGCVCLIFSFRQAGACLWAAPECAALDSCAADQAKAILLEHGAQHPGRLFVDLHALGEQIRRRFVVRLFHRRKYLARGLDDGLLAFD